MTHDQLVNWLCCATVYVEHTTDSEWLEKRWPVFEKCFESLLNRDQPNSEQRRGLMQLDSSRCRGGTEITTSDSLDVSLGQARNNIYLASKIWACYLGLEKLFLDRGQSDKAKEAHDQALRSASTLIAHVGADGTIPAVLENANKCRIIPAIEGLVFPYFNGRRDALDSQGEFGELLAALRRHLEVVLQPGQCLFPDGVWKLSSTSDNSWLSKFTFANLLPAISLGCLRAKPGHGPMALMSTGY